MALTKISAFNWEKILSKVDNPEVKRSLNLLRARANEITSAAGKYSQEVHPIDFQAYKKNLKFTGSAVDSLEKAYKNHVVPSYNATIPSFEAKKREVVLSVVNKIVASAKADYEQLNSQIAEFEKIRITKDTSYGELRDRFPQFGREIETEIKNHEWAK